MRRIDLRWGATETFTVNYDPANPPGTVRAPELVRMVDRGMPRTWSLMGRLDLRPTGDATLRITPRLAFAVGVGSSNWEMLYDARGTGDGPFFVDGTGQGSLLPAATISGTWIVDIAGGLAPLALVFTCSAGISPFSPYITEEERAELCL